MKKCFRLLMAFAIVAVLFSCKKENLDPVELKLSVNPTSLVFPRASQGAKTVSVTSNVDWTVTCEDLASADKGWVVVHPLKGTGDGTFTVNVLDNETNAPRTSTISVVSGDKKIEIALSQTKSEIHLDKGAAEVAATGGTVVTNVTANEAWTVVAPEGFEAAPAAGTGSEAEPVAVTITVSANQGGLSRTANVIFRITEDIADTLTVTQGREITPEMKADSLALIAIYNAADGANWKADKVWDLSKPFYNWSGVTTSETTGRVTALKITAASTITSEWELPTEIGNLTELTDLRFNGQNVKGALPDAICNLTKLQNLYFQNDKLSGSLPVNLGNLTELTAFYIDRNASLEGSLPESMGNLTKLANLNIAKTSISGTVPSTMKNCASLKNFMADATKLTGIGDNWDEYPAIEIIQFINTPTLEGSLPASIGKSKTVKTVQLYNCNFTGNVPEDWGSLPATCTKLQIYNNKLQGVLPAAFVAHAKYGTWNATVNIFPQQEGYILTPPVDAGTEVH